MTKYHSVREVNMICRGERPDWEYLTEDGAWSREHDAAALFDTDEEAEAHCPQGGFLVHTELEEDLIPLTLDEVIAILQGLRAKLDGETLVIQGSGHPIASIISEDGRVVLMKTVHEGAWVEDDEDDGDEGA